MGLSRMQICSDAKGTKARVYKKQQYRRWVRRMWKRKGEDAPADRRYRYYD